MADQSLEMRMQSVGCSRRVHGGFGTALLALCTATAWAQTPRDQNAATTAAAVSQLESIVVTDASDTGMTRVVPMGALGSQTILDTPFSIQSVDASHLRAR